MMTVKDNNRRAARRLFALLLWTVILLVVTVGCCGFAAAKNRAVRSIQVTNIRYDAITLKRGGKKKLKISCLPANATNKRVKVKSLNPKIVTYKNGYLHAKKKGTAVIRITAADKGGATYKLKVTVGTPVKRITTDVTSVSLYSGKTKTISATVSPSNASNKTLRYASSNKKIASVNAKGKITAKAKGTAYIYVYSADSRAKQTIRVKSKYRSFTYTLKKGETAAARTIAATTWANAAGVTFKSSNKSVAKVSKAGKITAKAKGTATITLTYGYRQATITLTVGTPVSGITLADTDRLIMNTSAPVTLSAVVTPSDASNKKLSFSSSNKKTATVSADGRITPLKAGTVTITATSADGRAKATLPVEIYKPAALVVQTAYGALEGYAPESMLAEWSDVPYAAPPVGALRWHAPADCEPWSGVRPAKTAEKMSAQVKSGVFSGSEDCLYLNVIRPNTTQTGLPVVVFLHGGSNLHGSKDGYNLSLFAQRNNLIVVSVNYRLGAFGFFSAEALKTGDPLDDSGNYALLDIKKSLEWVQQNIGVFGGDKTQVTLMGYSSGAKNAAATLLSPLFQNLYARMILLSGSMTPSTPEQAQTAAQEAVARALKTRGAFASVSAAKSYLQSLSTEAYRELLYSLSEQEVAGLFTGSFDRANALYAHILDGYLLPADGFAAFRRGAYNPVPVLIGSCSSDFSTFLLDVNAFDDALNWQSLEYNPEKAAIARLLLYYGNRLYTGYNLDNTARVLARSATPATVYAYRMAWGEDADVTGEPYFSSYIGAHHGMDLDFIRGSFGNNHKAVAPDLFSSENLAGRTALSHSMMRYFGNFIRTGNPNGDGLKTWESWTATTERFMQFDASKTADRSQMSDETVDSDTLWASVQQTLAAPLIQTHLDSKFFGVYREAFRAALF